MDERYEQQAFPLGVGGAILIAVIAGVSFPFARTTVGFSLPALLLGMAALFVFALIFALLSRYVYWGLDAQGVDWRGYDLRRRRRAWSDVEAVALVGSGRSLPKTALRLTLRDGRGELVGPSKGRVERQAIALLERYAERNGVEMTPGRGLAMSEAERRQDEDEQALVASMAGMDTKEKLALLQQEAERRRQQQQLDLEPGA